jgi:predicted dehydrogenase
MTNVVRLGVVGAGAIAQRGILPHLSQPDVQDRVVLQAVCDPVSGRAEAAAAKFKVRQAFTSYEELLSRGNVDAVTIASPIGLHYRQGRQALDAGKHIHFNKTMTTTTAEATELIEVAEAQGLKIVASPGEILRPQIQHVRELIAEGAIGTLCWAVCGSSFGRYHEGEKEFRSGDDVLSNVDPSWYFRKPGGGPLYDITVYQLHMITSVLGRVQRVTAMSGTRIAERQFRGLVVPTDAHDNTLILLDFGNNVFALAYGTAAGSPSGWCPTYYGTTGVIADLNLNGKPIQYPGRELADEAPGWTDEQWLLPHVVGPHRTIEEQHVFEDIMQLVDWIRDDTPTRATAQQARHVIEIIEAAYIAAETGQTQALTTHF